MSKTFAKRKKVIYEFICDDFYVPMKIKEIAAVLQIPREQRDELKEVLTALAAEGKIYVTPKGKYVKGQASHQSGVFQANARGFGFVIPAEGAQDVFISEENVGGALDGDQVEFVITKSPEEKRQEGKIVKVVSRAVTKVVGMYEKSRNFGFVRPDNQRVQTDIYIPAGQEYGAVSGHKVVAELTSYGGQDTKPEGKIVEILGFANEPGTDILAIIKDHNLPIDFSQKIMNQAERVGKEVSAADMAGRMDLRDILTVTIDGEDAKDLDDAVSVSRSGDNYILGVHIADVANYVQERSALDQEALKRGTSVYLVDRVIPMLPFPLSNGICSLSAGVDRLALSCIMTVNPKGEMISHQIAETVIHVNERMTYTSVAKILKQDIEETARYQQLVPLFEQMKELSRILREHRKHRGSIDFDFPETKIVLNEDGDPIEIKPYDRNIATKIIEDFMLLANETVAEEYFWRELPFLYRTHEAPDEERIKKLSMFINNFGYHIHVGSEVRPMEVQKLLGRIEGTPEEHLISKLALRSMKQARYSPENAGHFGLAAKYYTHFTSPIRRYPDLQIHRIIKDTIRGRMNEERIEHYQKILPEVALQSSVTERHAEEAERETIKLKKAEYMKEHVGETFEGVISGMTKWGIYVELPNTIEGMVHVTNMWDDFYEYREDRYEFVGERTGKTFKLGQRVLIRVLRVDLLRRGIDFELFDEKESMINEYDDEYDEEDDTPWLKRKEN